MTTPINLNKARKARARADDKARADGNAVKFGRSKAERQLSDAQEKLASDRLSALKRDDD